ncbi:MAG TPA: hypothetical protein VIJ94_03965 [Caulobacteraceae bacterium]
MSEDTESIPFRSASETTRRWLASQRWHPVTWLLVIAGLLHLVGDIVMGAVLLTPGASGGSVKPLAENLAEILHMVGYSLLFFGTAATVEYLFRIWGELRLRRQARDHT